jgi:hypothetical protein
LRGGGGGSGSVASAAALPLVALALQAATLVCRALALGTGCGAQLGVYVWDLAVLPTVEMALLAGLARAAAKPPPVLPR